MHAKYLYFGGDDTTDGNRGRREKNTFTFDLEGTP